MSDQLCTTADVKARIPIADANDDALISDLIDGVSDWIEDATGRKLVPVAATTYTLDSTYGSVIAVRIGVRAVSMVEIATGDQPDTGGTYTTFTGSVLLRPTAIDRRVGWPATEIWLGGLVPQLRTAINGVRVTGDWGFATVPPAIKQLAVDAVVSAYQTRGKPSSSTLGAEGYAVFPWATFFSPGSPAARTVARYRGIFGIA